MKGIAKFLSQRQDGQILLIVVLAAVVSLTVGLSAVSRSITNTKVSTEEANSQKALSAAEAGIEKLLSDATVGTSTGSLSNDADFTATVTEVRNNTVRLNDGGTVYKDEGADVWLSVSDFSGGQWSGNLTIRWTNNSASCTQNAAIEVAVISGTDRNNPTLTRYAYGSSCAGRADGFTAPTLGSGAVSGKTYDQGFTIPITNGYIARVIPVYANTTVVTVASGATSLPAQGNTIDSVGTSGNTSRKIRVYQGYPRIPIEFFPYNLFLPL